MSRSPILVLIVAIGLAACGGGETASESVDATVPTVTGPTTKTQREAIDGQADDRALAAEVAGTTLTGEQVALGDFRGRPVFVKVFAGN
jgi:hypothetical protein